MTVTTYNNDITVRLKHTDDWPSPYIGRDLVLLTSEHDRVVFKEIKPDRIQWLIDQLQEEMAAHFVRTPDGKWKNK